MRNIYLGWHNSGKYLSFYEWIESVGDEFSVDELEREKHSWNNFRHAKLFEKIIQKKKNEQLMKLWMEP